MKFLLAHNYYINCSFRNYHATHCWFTIIKNNNYYNFKFISDTHPLGTNMNGKEKSHLRLRKYNK